jgi:hypothetical protein
MKIRIGTTEEDYFLKLLHIVKVLPPFSKLRDLEIKVLAELFSYNHQLRDIPAKQRNLILFSTDNKKEIMESLNISSANFYNSMSRLRSFKILKGDALVPKYTLLRHKEVTFIFGDNE